MRAFIGFSYINNNNISYKLTSLPSINLQKLKLELKPRFLRKKFVSVANLVCLCFVSAVSVIPALIYTFASVFVEMLNACIAQHITTIAILRN